MLSVAVAKPQMADEAHLPDIVNSNKAEKVHRHADGGPIHVDTTHSFIGLALTFGFVFMFLVDQLGLGSCQMCTRPFAWLCSSRCNRRTNTLREYACILNEFSLDPLIFPPQSFLF